MLIKDSGDSVGGGGGCEQPREERHKPGGEILKEKGGGRVWTAGNSIKERNGTLLLWRKIWKRSWEEERMWPMGIKSKAGRGKFLQKTKKTLIKKELTVNVENEPLVREKKGHEFGGTTLEKEEADGQKEGGCNQTRENRESQEKGCMNQRK